jgi:hypothetical protein
MIDLLVSAVEGAMLGCATSAATPTIAPTPSPPDPTRSPATFKIDGCVQHFSGCGGSLEFGTVHLSPLGRTASVDLGYFTFQGVPPGDYTLTYSPPCNPAGCTSPVKVQITDSDEYAAFWRS